MDLLLNPSLRSLWSELLDSSVLVWEGQGRNNKKCDEAVTEVTAACQAPNLSSDDKISFQQ